MINNCNYEEENTTLQHGNNTNNVHTPMWCKDFLEIFPQQRTILNTSYYTKKNNPHHTIHICV